MSTEAAFPSGLFREFLSTQLEGLQQRIEERILELVSAGEQAHCDARPADRDEGHWEPGLERVRSSELRDAWLQQGGTADGPEQQAACRRLRREFSLEPRHSAAPPEQPEDQPRHSASSDSADWSPGRVVRTWKADLAEGWSALTSSVARRPSVGNDAAAEICEGAGETFSIRKALKREHVVYAGSIPNASQGILHGIILTATSGKATCQAEVVDRRSFLTRMKSGNHVEGLLAAVIIINTAIIGISASVAEEWIGWIWIDAFFALFFSIELFFSMRAVGIKRYFIGDGSACPRLSDSTLRWRYFEFVVVVLAVLECTFTVMNFFLQDDLVQDLAFFRFLRLTRMFRIVRVARLSLFAELIMMINGAIGGMRTLLWSIVLIAVPIYAVGLLLKEALGKNAASGQGAELFATLPAAVFTLFRCIIGGDCTTHEGRPIFALVSATYGWAYGVLYCVTMLLMVFGLFNVIAALYVENTVAAAKYNEVFRKRKRLQDAQMFAEKVMQLVEFIWFVHKTREIQAKTSSPDWQSPSIERHTLKVSTDSAIMDEVSSIQLTPALFQELRSFKEFQDILKDLEVSDEDQMDLFDTLDVDGGGTIDLEELVIGIAKLRGDARRSDIVGVSLIVRAVQSVLARFEEASMQKLEEHSSALHTLQDMLRKNLAGRSTVDSGAPTQHMRSGTSSRPFYKSGDSSGQNNITGDDKCQEVPPQEPDGSVVQWCSTGQDNLTGFDKGQEAVPQGPDGHAVHLHSSGQDSITGDDKGQEAVSQRPGGRAVHL